MKGIKKISAAKLGGAAAVTAGLTLALAAAAHAAPPAEGWYGGLSLNSSGLGLKPGDIDGALANQGIGSSSSLDRRDTNFGLNLGYRLNRNFAVEGGYTDLGRYNFNSSVASPAADALNGNFRAHAWSVSGVGILPFDNNWSGFGRLGVTRTWASLSPSSASGATTPGGATADRTGLVFGGGASYDFNRNWFGKAEVDRYTDVGDSSTGHGDVDVLSVGVGYKF